jgi:hypothetical protein
VAGFVSELRFNTDMWPFKSAPNHHDEALRVDFEKAKAVMQPLQIVGQGEGFNVVVSVCP